MANHKSSKKRIVRNAKKEVSNHARMSKIRTAIKAFLKKSVSPEADAKTKLESFRKVEAEIARGAAHGTMHKKTAARKISRLAKKAKAA